MFKKPKGIKQSFDLLVLIYFALNCFVKPKIESKLVYFKGFIIIIKLFVILTL
jgi:hypothetical protein